MRSQARVLLHVPGLPDFGPLACTAGIRSRALLELWFDCWTSRSAYQLFVFHFHCARLSPFLRQDNHTHTLGMMRGRHRD